MFMLWKENLIVNNENMELNESGKNIKTIDYDKAVGGASS